MASIRRTLSPVPRPGTLVNGEACSVASPLSKSSSCTQNHPPSGGFSSSPFSFLGYVFYRTHSFLLGLFSQRSSRPIERSKSKGQVWRRALFHFFICFVVGFFVGLTPFVTVNLSSNLMSKHQTFSFEVITPFGKVQPDDTMQRNVTPLVDSWTNHDNATLGSYVTNQELRNGLSDDSMQPQNQDSDMVFHKLLIIVTPTYTRPFQAYYLNRLAHTLKLISPPLLWIVVDMASQSAETADVLRRSGVMYRHLVCNKNTTDGKDKGVHQRNVALSHIETHRLDGIVYFADDDNIYSVDLFEKIRQIRRLGTWMVAKLMENKSNVLMGGPICNGTQVVGWHTNEVTRRFRRFHAEMSGFAFNSTVLWDLKTWHRPTLESVRHLDTVKDGFQASTFIEQIVEDESQMEGLLPDCSRIMVWHLHVESSFAYPRKWFLKNNGVIAPLA